jgi:hypothetical protein
MPDWQSWYRCWINFFPAFRYSGTYYRFMSILKQVKQQRSDIPVSGIYQQYELAGCICMPPHHTASCVIRAGCFFFHLRTVFFAGTPDCPASDYSLPDWGWMPECRAMDISYLLRFVLSPSTKGNWERKYYTVCANQIGAKVLNSALSRFRLVGGL